MTNTEISDGQIWANTSSLGLDPIWTCAVWLEILYTNSLDPDMQMWSLIRFYVFLVITKTRLFKYIENFTTKNWKFLDKKIDIFFHISAQNIDCGYSLEPF